MWNQVNMCINRVAYGDTPTHPTEIAFTTLCHFLYFLSLHNILFKTYAFVWFWSHFAIFFHLSAYAMTNIILFWFRFGWFPFLMSFFLQNMPFCIFCYLYMAFYATVDSHWNFVKSVTNKCNQLKNVECSINRINLLKSQVTTNQGIFSSYGYLKE